LIDPSGGQAEAMSAPSRLCRGEDAADGVRRVAREQLDLVAEQLDAGTGPRGDLDGAVHETRKAFKRLRALVRVSRDALGDEAYRRENTIFRDAGRRLSGPRDAAVMVQTLDALTARYRDELGDDAFAGLRTALAAEAAAASRELADDRATVDEVEGALEAARRRIGGWPLPDDGGLAMLEPGFERIYRRGRRALKAARKDPDTESLHELRKRGKDLWHAAQVLRPAAPKPMKKLARGAHALSDLVGDDHDLAVLRAAARERRAALAPGELALLEALVARRRRRLQRKALARGKRLYARKPARLAKLVR
jgi:CHAD domain-containing protein